jgi:hypothetical protein
LRSTTTGGIRGWSQARQPAAACRRSPIPAVPALAASRRADGSGLMDPDQWHHRQQAACRCGWGGDRSGRGLPNSWTKPLAGHRPADTVVAGRAPRRCDPISHRR